MCVLHIINRSGLKPYPVTYAVANPVRGLLDRKKSKEHLLIQSANGSTKQQKQDKKKEKKKGNKNKSKNIKKNG